MIGLWLAAAAVQAGAGGQVVNDPRLAASTQQVLAQRAVAACLARGAHVAAAVATADGTVRTLLSDEGASRVAVETARRKAISAVLVGYPTSGLTKAAAEAPAYVEMLRSIEPGLIAIGGGVPVRVGGALVGGLGVGGAAGPDADEGCDLAAIEGVLGRAAR